MEIATTKMSSRGQIVIPVELRKDIKEGENLLIIKSGDDLIIKKRIPVLADEKLLGEDWLSPEEDEAWKDL